VGMTFLERSACVVACLLIGACGGKVAGPATGDGTAGASGTLGDGTGTGTDPAPGQSTTTGTSGTGTLPAGTPSCQSICDRITQAGCVVEDCLKECDGSIIANSPCADQFAAALQCFAVAPIQCSMSGQGVEFFGCDRQRDLVSQCLTQTVPSMPPTPAPTKPIPMQCLGGAPVPPGGMVCSGGGSAGGTGGTGGGAPPTCQAECDDAKGNVWSSYCVGANCSCMYNGQTYCSCVSAAPCSSCCPGI